MSAEMQPMESAVRELEQRVAALFELVEMLSAENRSLRQARQTLSDERARLQERNEEAALRIDGLIERLAALEETANG